MKKLPNGLTVFNGTPHPIRFWASNWPVSIEIEPDEKIDAQPQEEEIYTTPMSERAARVATFVHTIFKPTQEGRDIVCRAYNDGADVVVGSIIAAQAYPGVVAMVPCEGYERVPPAEKRMRPDKFTAFC